MPAEKAATRMTAFTMCGRARIPASSMPITQGEAEASEAPEMRRGLLGETMREILCELERVSWGWDCQERESGRT